MDGDATACSTLRPGPSSPNRIVTPLPASASASVDAMCVCRTTGPVGMGTVVPSMPFNSARTEGYAASAKPSSTACCASSASSSCVRSTVRPRACSQPSIWASRPGTGASGCRRSTGSRGPVCVRGATDENEDASMRSIAAPLARAGTGPTHTITGTGILAMRSASPTAACPMPPALSTSSTTVAPRVEASSSIPLTNPSRGRSSAPSTLTTSTGGSIGCASAARAAVIDEPRTPTTSARRSGAFMDVPSYRPPRGILAWIPMRTSLPPSQRTPTRPVTDRWAYKPVALLLLVPVIVAAAGLTAVVIAPPFVGLSLGVKELNQRLDAAGANFTRIPPIPQRSTIYANDGKTVLARDAVLAIEDSGFYEHGALNPSSMLRALAANIRAGKVVQGGSTITQELVKLTLGDPTNRSFGRKFQEVALAMRVEQKYAKNKILEMYLNQVYLGNNVYGIATAAQYYFHRPASRLTLPQAALLAGLIRAPNYYDPLQAPHKAWLRRNDVLNRMIGLGPTNGGVTYQRGARAKKQPLGLPKNVGQIHLPAPPFIVDYVKQQIHDDPNGWYTFLGATPDLRDKALAEGV